MVFVGGRQRLSGWGVEQGAYLELCLKLRSFPVFGTFTIIFLIIPSEKALKTLP